jgi:hypothetical protein
MTGPSAFRLGQGIGGLIAIGLVILYAMRGDFLRLTSDDARRNIVLWTYDRDAAPGQTLGGRAWLDSESGWIVGVNVYVGGERIAQDDCPGDCRDRWVDFAFAVPKDIEPGRRIGVEFEVITRPDDDTERFNAEVPIYSRGMSMLRRIGKGGLAIACLAAVAALVFGLKRLAIRRAREPSGLWLVPVVAAGVFTFVPLTEQATRLHGWWFVGVALAAWAAGVFTLAERFHRRIGLSTFTATPVLIETGPDGGYRGAQVTTPIKPVDDLEAAWSAAGLTARRAGSDLIITKPRGLFAVVPMPASESFGSEPLTFRANDSELAKAIVLAAGTVLGELRMHEDVAL